MSLRESLRELRSRQAADLESQKQKQLKADQQEKTERDTLRRNLEIHKTKTDSLFKPTLELIRQEYIEGEGTIGSVIYEDVGPYHRERGKISYPSQHSGSVISLKWGETKNREGLQYHAINIDFPLSGNNFFVEGAASSYHLRHFSSTNNQISLEDETWQEQLGKKVLEILETGKSGFYHFEPPYERP